MCPVSCLPFTGAGNFGLTRDPSGAMTLIGLYDPSLRGVSGSNAHLIGYAE